MYQYNGNHIEIEDYSYNFEYDVRTVIHYDGKYIVLLGIPYDSEAINNIYCLDAQAKIIWQSEDLARLYPKLKKLAYEQMSIKDGFIYATDFYGRSYKIDVDSGKIAGCKFVK